MNLPNTEATAASLHSAVADAIAVIQSLQGQVASLESAAASSSSDVAAADAAAAADIQPDVDALAAAVAAATPAPVVTNVVEAATDPSVAS